MEACDEAFIPGRSVCSLDTYVAWAGSLLFEAGVNIIPVDDKTPWQEKVQPLIDAQLSTDDLKAFYQTIVDMAE